MKKIIKKIFIFIFILGCLCLLLFIGANIYRRVRYGDFYQKTLVVASNDGLGDGYTPQDLTAYKYDEEIIYFTCGTMQNGPSRIYVIRGNKEEMYFELLDESDNLIHEDFEGIATTGDYLLIAGGDKLYQVNLNNIGLDDDNETNFLNNRQAKQVKVDDVIDLEAKAQFLYVNMNNTSSLQDDSLIVGGSFENGKSYAYVYNLSQIFANKLTYKYRFEVPKETEGLAIANNQIMLVIPNGAFNASTYNLYDMPTEFDEENTYILDDRYLKSSIEGPSLAAGLDYVDGNFITLFQSASNDYIYGKFIFTNKIIALEVN